MNSGLTKREKVLIIIAVSIVVIFVAFKFVFLPVYDKYYETTEKNAQLDTDKQLMELKLLNEKLIKESFKKAQAKHDDSKKHFPEIMTNEELDRLITGLCLENNVIPTLLGMSVIKKEEPVSSEPVSSEAALDEKTLSDRTTSSKSSSEESSSEPELISVFAIATATINASGTYEDLQKIITQVNETTHIRINSLKYVYTKAAADSGIKPPEITIVFEVTMVDGDKLQYDKVA